MALLFSACGGLIPPQTDGPTPPVNVQYALNPAVYVYGSAITPNEISYTGEAASRFTINPTTLPDGLSFDTSTGAISGTPTTITPPADYIVNAYNDRGSGYVKLTLAVGDVLPTITYGGLTTRVLTVGTSIGTISPTLGGGTTTSCDSSPTLPAGLNLSSACVLTGTPTTPVTAADYVISARNSGGSDTLTFNLTVNDVAPSISYPGASANLTRATAVNQAATNTGGTIVSCSVAPALPTGLSLSSSCAITGTPSAATPSATYSITATNSGGTDSESWTFAVIDVIPAVAYSGGPFAYTISNAISTISPTSTGGLIDSCSVAPALPTGLSLSATTCVITGTPTAITAAANYTVTATNSAGSGNAVINIAVNDAAPTITNFGGPYIWNVGSAISPTAPITGGGSITGCSASPALPSGLSISATTCAITGTPTGTQGATNHTITATNSGGSGTAVINITVNNVPPSLTYGGSPYTFTQGNSIGSISPTNSGGMPTSCSASPALPSGLSISSTCVLSGTPSAGAANANYVISTANSAGTANVSIQIAVTAITPPNLSFAPTFNYIYTKDAAITTLAPSNSGGAIVSCSSSPTLPPGLSIASNCQITGTPLAVRVATDYAITATNGGGSSSATVNLEVRDELPALSYVGGPFSYPINSAITTLTPANAGGAVISCSSSPALPAGLSLAADCSISGTPTVVSAATAYTISATNSAGTATAAANIAVNDLIPAISYSGGPYIYTQNTAITALNAVNTGGTITGCSSSPVLPTGLSISSTCSITGTPTTVVAAANYTISATNSGGTATAIVNIRIRVQPPSINYPTGPFLYGQNIAITPLVPTSNGGAISNCTISPAIPAGLSLSTTTCGISGTPTAIVAATNFSVTASNASGSNVKVVNIEVRALPAIDYIPTPYTFTYTRGTAIAALTPNSTGAAIVSCAVSPALPTGLSLNTTNCSITGTPSAIRVSTDYTVTASNAVGSDSEVITITVNDTAPVFTFPGGTHGYVEDSAITALTPTSTGGTIVSCSASPSLPVGLVLGSTCEISGTPTTITAAADYSITATNSGGSSSATVNIAIIDIAPSISFTPNTATYVLRTLITAATPANAGGAITSCGISPALPAGLSLSNSTCAISGTPTVTASNTAYTVTATNSGGSHAATFTFQVKNRPQVIFQSLGALNGAANGTAPLSSNIWKVSDDGVDLIALTVNSSAGLDSQSATFAPSGLAVLYSSLRAMDGSTNGTAPGSWNIWTSTSSGGSPASRTANTANNLHSDQPAAVSPDGTKVVFASRSAIDGSDNGAASDSFNIFIMNADGSGRLALTQNTIAGIDSMDPTFSPDGLQVFFASKTEFDGSWNGGGGPSSYNIFKVNLDGTGLTALTTETAASLDSRNPAVSPDGTKVVFESLKDISASASSSNNVFVMNADGTGLSALTTETAAAKDSRWPRYSADGSAIVFASKMSVSGTPSSSFNIWKMAAAGTGQTALTTNTGVSLDSERPQFTPDGSRIVFHSLQNIGATPSSSRNIWLMDSDGTDAVPLTLNTNAGLDSQLGSARVFYAP